MNNKINEVIEKFFKDRIGVEKANKLIEELKTYYYIDDHGFLYDNVYIDRNDAIYIENDIKEKLQDNIELDINEYVDDLTFNYEIDKDYSFLSDLLIKYDIDIYNDNNEEIRDFIYTNYAEIYDIINDTELYIDIILASKNDLDTEGMSKQLIKKYINKNELKEIKENIDFKNENYFLATQLKITYKELKDLKNRDKKEKIKIYGDFNLLNVNAGSVYDYYFLNKKSDLQLDITIKLENLLIANDYNMYTLTQCYCNDYCTISQIEK